MSPHVPLALLELQRMVFAEPIVLVDAFANLVLFHLEAVMAIVFAHLVRFFLVVSVNLVPPVPLSQLQATVFVVHALRGRSLLLVQHRVQDVQRGLSFRREDVNLVQMVNTNLKQVRQAVLYVRLEVD